MQAAVIVFPGSNCDRDVAVALEQASGRKPHMVWHKETEIPKVDLIVLPGGFSYGDYLRCGAMAAHSPAMRETVARAEKGTPVLGICNGFQILTEAKLLPGALLPNKTLTYICKDVTIRVETSQSLFTNCYEEGQALRIPVAHHDGCYTIDEEGRKRLEDQGQIAFRYCAPDGSVTPEANPNGSLSNIAGVFSRTKNVLGLMPHPERLADPALGGTDGRGMFQSIAGALV